MQYSVINSSNIRSLLCQYNLRNKAKFKDSSHKTSHSTKISINCPATSSLSEPECVMADGQKLSIWTDLKDKSDLLMK